MEPLVIGRLAMENGNGAVRVRAAFNNMTIRGGSNYTITWIKYGHKHMFQSLNLHHLNSQYPLRFSFRTQILTKQTTYNHLRVTILSLSVH